MEQKIKLIQTLEIHDLDVSYDEIIEQVNNIKNKILKDLVEEGFEDKFEIVVNVLNKREDLVIGNDNDWLKNSLEFKIN